VRGLRSIATANPAVKIQTRIRPTKGQEIVALALPFDSASAHECVSPSGRLSSSCTNPRLRALSHARGDKAVEACLFLDCPDGQRTSPRRLFRPSAHARGSHLLVGGRAITRLAVGDGASLNLFHVFRVRISEASARSPSSAHPRERPSGYDLPAHRSLNRNRKLPTHFFNT